MLELAGLKAGESVLDVGCGTGTLAIAAKHRVGSSGRVYGIDASPEMIARARKKAAAEITFEKALVENLPFQDTNFDVVLCTTVLDHLPDKDERFALHPRRLADEHMMHRRTIATTP
jgi:demethylmenaquinone methyltransferase/2-methoxy-6-polyprenyl-1,4-benzoquinol methylase/phosphoethanolamine N-methyltransferase